MVPIFTGKGDIRNCSCYRAVKIIEHRMNMVESVFEDSLNRIMTVDEMLFGVIPERGTIDAVFILRRLHEEYHAKGETLCMCFVDQKKDFDGVLRKVLEWAMRKKGIPDVLDRSVLSLYRGAKTRVRVDYELSEEFEVKLGMHQGSVLSSFLFVVVVDAAGEFVREVVLSELLYGDDFVLMSETNEWLKDDFIKWKETFESKCLKLNLVETKVIFSSDITEDGLSKVKLTHVGSAA